jgi:hypothetical protein
MEEKLNTECDSVSQLAKTNKDQTFTKEVLAIGLGFLIVSGIFYLIDYILSDNSSSLSLSSLILAGFGLGFIISVVGVYMYLVFTSYIWNPQK